MRLYRFRRYGYFFAILTALFIVLVLPSFLPLQTPTQQQATMQQNNIQSQQATAVSIFNNNLFIAGFTLVPYVGWGYLIYVMWNTGKVISSYSQPWFWVLNNVFAWIELSVYSYMILKSIKLIQLFKQRKTCFIDLDGKCIVRRTNGVWNQIVTTAMFALILACIVLLASAMIEYFLITRTVLI